MVEREVIIFDTRNTAFVTKTLLLFVFGHISLQARRVKAQLENVSFKADRTWSRLLLLHLYFF
jgi:hypothetical protein